ncbi:hypothetical protein [Silvibacterium sp.]|uniref:hypothetical protein n=1 Tax=Silvibacterium sp. TaxID=1964179 RepID=UPI0039E3432B
MSELEAPDQAERFNQFVDGWYLASWKYFLLAQEQNGPAAAVCGTQAAAYQQGIADTTEFSKMEARA